MLGASAICEHAISDQTILLAGVADISGVASTANAGVGIMSGVSTLIPAFTQTSTGTFISSGANAELDFNYTKTSVGVRLRLGVSTPTPEFIQDTNGSFTASGVSTKTGVFTQTSAGSLLFVEIDPDADESYTTITPSGTETWTEIEV
jgi:hypothetical protein